MARSWFGFKTEKFNTILKFLSLSTRARNEQTTAGRSQAESQCPFELVSAGFGLFSLLQGKRRKGDDDGVQGETEVDIAKQEASVKAYMVRAPPRLLSALKLIELGSFMQSNYYKKLSRRPTPSNCKS